MQSYKHRATRHLIPSKEEAGMEDGDETVSRKSAAELIADGLEEIILL